MATTPNIQLNILPEGDEIRTEDNEVLNDNFSKLDSAVGEIQSAVSAAHSAASTAQLTANNAATWQVANVSGAAQFASVNTGKLTATPSLVTPSGRSGQQYFFWTTATVTHQGSGYSLGNSGGWSGSKMDYKILNSSIRGISQTHSFTHNKHGVGDAAGIYGYVYSDGGISAQSDEAMSGITVEVFENNGYFHGTVAATIGLGDRKPQWAYTSGNNWNTDGAYMLNISKGIIAGNMLAPSRPFTPTTQYGVEATFLRFLPVADGCLPVSSAIGISTTTVGTAPFANTTADTPVSRTITVRLVEIDGVPQPFTPGHVMVAGNYYPEQSIITSAELNEDGTQSITLGLRNPNAQIILFQGGVAGQYISFDANLDWSGMRSSYFAFGSVTGNDLICGVNVCGSINSFLPQTDQEAARADGGPKSGFHLYPGAEVVSNPVYSAPRGTLEPNNVDWEVGDVVENPHYPIVSGSAARFSKIQHSPGNGQYGNHGLMVACGGKGWGGNNSHMLYLENSNPLSNYTPNGGPLVLPNAISIYGPHAHTMYVRYAPPDTVPSALLFVQNEAYPGQPLVNVIALNWTPSGNLQFDTKAHAWKMGSLILQGTLSVGASLAGANASFSGDLSAKSVTAATKVTTGNLTTSALTFATAVTATQATAGAATALPASPEGYLQMIVNGKTVLVPYFAK